MSDERVKKTDLMSEAERDAYHADKMRKKKEARTRMVGALAGEAAPRFYFAWVAKELSAASAPECQAHGVAFSLVISTVCRNRIR